MKDPNYKHRSVIAMSTTGKLQPIAPQKSTARNQPQPRVRVQVQVSPQDPAAVQAAHPVEDSSPVTQAAYGITAPAEESEAPTPVIKKPFHFLKTLFAR